jgi:nuclear protein localization family protein 4
MILRFRGPDGQFRLEVDSTDDFASILPKLADILPKNTNPSTITVSNRPQGGDARPLATLKGVTFNRIGIK